ncbi:hypothetical protein QQ045_022219 [Rhodiola kirilowii]
MAIGIRLLRSFQGKQSSRRVVHCSDSADVPKGYFAVYVGENRRKRFMVPISYLKHPSFQILLKLAEEEFGFNHPVGGLMIPCREEAFITLTSQICTT